MERPKSGRRLVPPAFPPPAPLLVKYRPRACHQQSLSVVATDGPPMIDQARPPQHDVLAEYRIAQLQFACAKPAREHLFHDDEHTIPVSDFDYDARRMSSSAASAAESDASLSEKRSATPHDSPDPKRRRPTLDIDANAAWSAPDDKSAADSAADPAHRVQLPSIFDSFHDPFNNRDALRRPSLPALPSDRARHAYGPAAQSPRQSASGLASYQFPAQPQHHHHHSDALGLQHDPAGPRPSSASSSFLSTPSTFGSPLSPEPGAQPGAHGLKYDDSLRHSSLGGPLASAQMFGGTTRISGQDRQRGYSSGGSPDGVKSEQWNFSGNDLVLPASGSSYNVPGSPQSSTVPSISVTASPSRSPQQVPQSSSLVERPPRKRGKLPKHVTDFLKDWLHRHSDHPYPSEEEKKQLCHATGLSMSQVSNWMINARRRILAPAQRAASNPSTTSPYPASRPSTSSAAILQNGRRASMPTDSLQLYHPLSLQSLPSHHSAPDYLTSRHMMGTPRASISGAYGMDYSASRLGYVPGQGYLSSSSSVPLTAPAALASSPLSLHSAGTYQQQQQQQQQALYAQQSHHHSHSGAGYLTSPQNSGGNGGGGREGARYYSDSNSQNGSAPGSGYPTPQ
ncbi:hypothetical protein GLOTRDRAFT_139231 [Gloeophyllum trabeum ATCC 11539]|uniref:Homeobox domain-containing protein n=1 Tax=Gloeophyllum trabeum (strain ATCC 11539 / FP-39264 / Madison 617) TaxID=670483 RepID=S7Q5E4_GLOTA|nr:uncharacterized protein GLOTRDRAFT_139231 [Gloeophyllum trabeum ATCC 11539]EPQ54713.1 hypothetical protein GLOTRDRAFT_139231 [Gloeophyllum trabeum ATCC 11539]